MVLIVVIKCIQLSTLSETDVRGILWFTLTEPNARSIEHTIPMAKVSGSVLVANQYKCVIAVFLLSCLATTYFF